MGNGHFRTESDTMGDVRVPRRALWGAQTQRAIGNFPAGDIRFPRRFIRALGIVKLAAAQANMELGLLDRRTGRAIVNAAREVIEGRHDDQFPVSIFQTGSGTSTNMNANEVIANLACGILGGKRGDGRPVHPNDHVNMGQSSNDVIPSATHIAALEGFGGDLLPALRALHAALSAKARRFRRVVKVGRTHLQDAAPVTLGQEFGGYASMVAHAAQRVRNARPHLAELALGGTAVGTGINAHPRFAPIAILRINALTGLRFREAEDHFEAQGARDAVVEASGALRSAAVSMMKIANDIRLLSSGPRGGLGELLLPGLQPGSSIMPGKVNPVIPEMVCQVAAQVIGNDAAVAVGGLSGNLELNTMMPLMAHNLLQSIGLLSSAASLFSEKCIKGLKADRAQCAGLLERNLAMATPLATRIGYEAAARVAREAHETGKSVREVARKRRVLPPGELDELLDPRRMAGDG